MFNNKPSRDQFYSKRAQQSRKREEEARKRKEEHRKSYHQLPAYIKEMRDDS